MFKIKHSGVLQVHMFCQAHEAYAAGLSEANRVLSDMRQHEEFLRFIKEPPLEPGQPSISAFIFRPLQVGDGAATFPSFCFSVCMCMCVHTCVCICVCVCVHTCVCVSVSPCFFLN